MTKWKLVPVEPTPEMYQASRLTTESEGIVTTTWLRSSVYRSMLEASPQPPKLSDERILELAARAEAQWNAVADQYNQWGQLGFDEIVILISRAIEREILGGGND